MIFNKLHNAHVLLLCATLVACNKTGGSYVAGDGDNAAITLSVGVDSEPQSTKAVITDGDGKIMKAFDANTKIFMVMKSEYGQVDYEGSHEAKYTVTRGDVVSGSNAVTFDSYNQRYWDDAHARSSQLSIWAYAQSGIPESDGWWSATFQIPSSTWSPQEPETQEHLLQEYESHQFLTRGYTNPWTTEVVGHSKGAIYPCIMDWNVSHYTDSGAATYRTQDANSVQYQDLMFSNNIANYVGNESVPAESRTDKRLKFDFTSRKFPAATDTWADDSKKTEMKFYHALSKITIHLKKGEGYTAGQFQFASGKNIELKGFNTTGTFNIKDGEFQQVSSYDVPKIYQHQTAESDDTYTLEALVIPNIEEFMSKYGANDTNSRFVSTGANDMMVFTIDGVEYKLTSKQLYNALHGKEGATEKTNGTIPLEPGKNYHFTFTLSKSGIVQFDASIKDWYTYTASDKFTNGDKSVSLNLYDNGTAQTSGVDFFRAKQTTSQEFQYEKAASPSYDGIKQMWDTPWFWETQDTKYNFRVLKPQGLTITFNDDADNSKDYSTAPLTTKVSFIDVCWGAPFDNTKVTDGKFSYDFSSLTPFGNQLYPAIGATDETIKLTMFHMMSHVAFKFTTTGEESADKVTLDDELVVNLKKYYPSGTLNLKTGKITASGDNSNTSLAVSKGAGDYPYSVGVVPQSIADMYIEVITSDSNRFLIPLKDLTATSVSNAVFKNPYTVVEESKYKIDKFLPGYKYLYHFQLSKQKVDNIQVKLVDWTNVVIDEEDIQIK